MTLNSSILRGNAKLSLSRNPRLTTSVLLLLALALVGCGGGSLVGEFQGNAPPTTSGEGTIGGGSAIVPAPTVGDVIPSTGDSSGGTTITINGANFKAGAIVLVGGKPATNVVVTNGNSIQAVIAPNAPGTYAVQVINPDKQSGAHLGAFTYLAVAPPTLIQVLPNSGPSSGGTVVILSGSNFQTGATVLFGGAAATSVTLQSPTQLQVTTPSVPAGIVNVQVVNPDSQTVTLTGGFTYSASPAPTITSVSPNSGPSNGGTAVVISGANFAAGLTVRFGGVSSTSVTVNSSTQISAITPLHSPGVVDLIVTNPDAQSATFTSAFNFVPAPSVSSVSPPASGPISGGTPVTITGSNFQGGATVLFGSTVATAVNVLSATQIQATTPAHAAGTFDVVVRNPDNQTGLLTGGFTFNLGTAPTITSVAPASGPVGGGTSVVITGTNFQTGATVAFGAFAAASATLNSATQITATAPAGSAGVVDVTVTNPDGQVGILVNGFAFVPPPTVASVSLPSGAASGGTLVTITGTAFQANATVSFGGTPSPNVTVVSATSIQAVTPAHAAGAANVVVTNPDTQTATLTNGFTFNAPPTVTSVSPSSGPVAGGTSVTITGTNFLAGAAVRIGGVFATGVVVNSATSITAVTPAGAAGPANVNVINTDGQLGPLAGGFTYNPAPTVTSVSPVSGPTGGGTVVQISGTGFLPGATVTFSATAATAVTVSSSTSILATSPAGAAGAVSVHVKNTDNQIDTSSATFTYTTAPGVTSVLPSSGPTAGGTPVTISGTNFVAGASVTFGLNAATGVVVNSANSITAVTPGGAVGSVTVTVTNPSLQAGSLPLGFSYTPPAPTVGGVNPTSGAATGGTLVTITGTNFVANATASFGGTASPNVTVVNATTIQAVTPAHTAGAANVIVTNPDTQFSTLNNGFTFNAAPTVTSVNPNNGPLAGGTSVTIIGTNFMAGPTVKFGANLATGVVFNSATSITAVSPAGAAGSFSVSVLNTDGQQGIRAGAFSYIPAPMVTSVSPNSGPLGGGTALLITGANFQAGATVTIGGTAATGVVVASPTSITAVAPAHAAGLVSVVVTNPDTQFLTLFSGYTYNPAPTVTSVAASSGPTSGGIAVFVNGTNFLIGATIQFGTAPATGLVFLSAGQYQATTPAQPAGAVSVRLTNADGQSVTLAGAFMYNASPPPSVSSVSPSFGPALGGTTITIAGSNFVNGATVQVGGRAASNVVVTNSTQIIADTPTHAAGLVPVQVTNPSGQFGSLANGFTFDAPPTISSVSPNFGSTAGGTTITLTGTAFDPLATVSIGGISASNVVFVSATSITAVTPAGSAGTVSVSVLNLDGQTAVLSGGFSYSAPAAAPIVTSVLPINGSQNGGTTVTITGTGFQSGASVRFGINQATGVVVNSSSSITAVTPAGTPGAAVAVRVTNPDTQFGTLPSAFAYLVSSVVVTTTDLPEGNPQVPYTIGFDAFGGVPLYTWAVSSGALPPGLTLDPKTGFLDGVPTQTGNFSFTVVVTDKATPSAQTATANFTLDIVPVPSGANAARLPQAFVDTRMPVQTGTVRNVTLCTQLQATINAAALGDTIVIDSSLTCIGQFNLTEKTTGAGWIIIQSSAMANLPPPGSRIKPAIHAQFMPKILTNVSTGRAVRALLRAHHYRLIGIEFGAVPGLATTGSYVDFDPAATIISDYPNFLVVDRCYIHGDPITDSRRGVGVGATNVAIIDSEISEIHAVGIDSQTIGGWSFPGPLKIVNNHLEAAAEHIGFGGSTVALAGVVPSDIEIRRNHFFKPLSWRPGDPNYAGIQWLIKNGMEVKNGQRVLIEGNIVENCWAAAQVGYLVVLTPSIHSSFTIKQAVAQDFVIRYNSFAHAPGMLTSNWTSASDDGSPSTGGPGDGVNVDCSGFPTQSPVGCLRSRRWHIHDNIAEDISKAVWGGDGRLIQILGPTDFITFENNTAFEDGSPFIDGQSGPASNPNRFTLGFVYRNNIVNKGKDGVFTTAGEGTVGLNFFTPGYSFVGNVIVGAQASIYPAGNFFPVAPMPSNINFFNFNSGIGGDYRLLPTSPYKNKGSNGKDPGARAGATKAAITGVQ